jgi:phosphoglycolate phosphatase-like HAD superfamily hydrolase
VPLVERLGIGHYFRRVDRLRVAGGGGKTEHLATHLAALEVEASTVLLVGDTLDDLAAVRAVGARCVLYDGARITGTRWRPPAFLWSTPSPPP